MMTARFVVVGAVLAAAVVPVAAAEAPKEASVLAAATIAAAKTGAVSPVWKELAGREDVLPLLEKAIDGLDPGQRENLVGQATRIGLPKDRQQERWVLSMEVSGFLVRRVLLDSAGNVRNTATNLLIKHVPDAYIAPFAESIVEAAKKWPQFYDVVLLLGKTGSPKARRLLMSTDSWMKFEKTNTEAALAKLGDNALSIKFINDFRKERNTPAKADLAAILGYIGDAGCVVALAQEIRSPAVYIRGAVQTSLRADVTDALWQVYPENKLLWISPIDNPRSNDWYEAIEKWLTEYLGMKWIENRPGFLYKTGLPIPLPPK